MSVVENAISNIREKREHYFGKYTAFVTFFPQLVADPVERAENLL